MKSEGGNITHHTSDKQRKNGVLDFNVVRGYQVGDVTKYTYPEGEILNIINKVKTTDIKLNPKEIDALSKFCDLDKGQYVRIRNPNMGIGYRRGNRSVSKIKGTGRKL